MSTDPRENLVDWLRDAHAMEMQAEKMLTAQSKRLEHYPQLKARIDQHIQETIAQQQAVQGCLSELGVDNSTLKDLAAQAMALAQAMGGMTASDEVVKGAMASYAFEHFEISAYTALAAAAAVAGEAGIQAKCEAIAAEEQQMADWLREHLPQVTQEYLRRAATPGQTAKV